MNDKINGVFELLGGMFIWYNVLTLYRDKALKGVSVGTAMFFSTWGFWNLYYYPSVGCMFSFACGINIVITNSTWVVLALYYSRRKE